MDRHAVNSEDRYDYDANGNMTIRNKGLSSRQTLEWNAENRLANVKNNSGATIESYVYDVDGNRIKKTSGGVVTRTFFPGHYEEEGSTTIKHYSFNGQTIATRKGSVFRYTHTDHLGSSSGQTSTSGAAVDGTYVRHYAYGTVRAGNPSTLNTDRTFTGQKADGTGLLYLNARYYDPSLGTFLSPDTLVPDAGRVFDYNRFAYARLNPLKYTDPSGHYTNDEIMQHYGCSDWACVESIFQSGSGSLYEGMWGWLYILQMAENGSRVSAKSGTMAQIFGTFQRTETGAIQIAGTDGGTYADFAYARYGGATLTGALLGSYGLSNPDGKRFWTYAVSKHNYFYVDPVEVAIVAAKSGKDLGPVIAAASPAACAAVITCPAAPIIFTVGEVYTAIGWGTWAITDVVAPSVAFLMEADLVPALESGASNVFVPWAFQQAGGAAASAAPYVGTAYDAAKLFSGACYGTGCPR